RDRGLRACELRSIVPMTIKSIKGEIAMVAKESQRAAGKIFDVGINEKLPPAQLLVLGLQNIFGMTGMFVFPGILGRSFNLAPEQIAYLYGMTFAVCGIVTI